MPSLFRIKNFRGFDDWIEYDPAKLTVVTGQNSSGKSSLLLAYKLLMKQHSIWELSFPPEERGISSFIEVVTDHDTNRTIDIEFPIRFYLDQPPFAFNDMHNAKGAFEYLLTLSYASHDGQRSSGVLASAELKKVVGEASIPIFSIRRSSSTDYTYYLGGKDILSDPLLVFWLLGGEYLDAGDINDYDRAIEENNCVLLIAAFKHCRKMSDSKEIKTSYDEIIDSLISVYRRMKRQIHIVIPKSFKDLGRPVPDAGSYQDPNISIPEIPMPANIDNVTYVISMPNNDCISLAGAVNEITSHSLEIFTKEDNERSDGFHYIFGHILHNAFHRMGDCIFLPVGRYFDEHYFPQQLQSYQNFLIYSKDTSVPGIVYVENDEEDQQGEGRTVRVEISDRERETHDEYGEPIIYVDRLALFNKYCRDLLGIGKTIEMLSPIVNYDSVIIDGHPLSESGYGIRQLFPILFSSLYAKIGTDILIEEPESNLHPNLQAKLAELFSAMMKDLHVGLIVETHSEYIIRQLQIMVAKKEFSDESINILYMYTEGNRQRCKKIGIEKNGQLSEAFGPGFLDQSSGQLNELLGRFYA